MDASAFKIYCLDDLGIIITIPKGMTVEEIADSIDKPSLWTELATLLNITSADETRIKMKLNSAIVRKRAADEQSQSSPKGKKPKRVPTPGGAGWADGFRAKSPPPAKTHSATSTNFLLDNAEKAREGKILWKITVVKPNQRIGSNSFWHWNAANIETIKGWLDCTQEGDFKGSDNSAAWEFRLSSSVVAQLKAMRIDVSPNANSFVMFNKYMKLQRSGEAERDLKTKQLAGDPASFKTLTEVNEVQATVTENMKQTLQLKLNAAGANITTCLAAMASGGDAEKDAEAMAKWRASTQTKDLIERDYEAACVAHVAKFSAIREALQIKISVAVVDATAATAAAKAREAPKHGLLAARAKSEAAKAAREAAAETAVEPAEEATEDFADEMVEAEAALSPAPAKEAGAGIMGLLASAN